MQASVTRAITLDLRPPRSEGRLQVRAVEMRVGGCETGSSVLLLAEPADHQLMSLSNGAESYWAEAALRLGVAGRESEMRFIAATSESPGEVNYLTEVLLFGGIVPDSKALGSERVRYKAARFASLSPDLYLAVSETYTRTLGGRLEEPASLMRAP